MSDLKEKPYQAEDTGHEWDGIRELKNPPPRWWMICFYLSGIWTLGYFILYPSIPLISSHTKGILGWTSNKEFNEGMREVEAIRAPFEKRIKEMTAEEILKDSEMSQFAVESSKVIFGDNCAPCHGAGGQGTKEFPTLADDDWLYGGKIENILETISGGHEGSMPAFKDVLSQQEMDDVVKFIQELPSGKIYEPGQKVFLGESKAEAECSACHGEDAKGVADMGSANLTDSIWRFDGSAEGIRQTISFGVNEDNPQTRKAKMPAFGEKLTPEQIKKLAVKVHLLGGGQ